VSDRTPPSRSALITEIGNRNTGDEVAYAATARRFIANGWRVSFAYRVRPRDEVFGGLPVELHELIVEDSFDGIASPTELVEAFARRHPQLCEMTRKLVAQHELVAIAPGGRFTSGYNNPRALLTAAIAQRLGVPVINLHQSIGPIDREEYRSLVARVFAQSRLNVVRDDLSRDFLLRLGVPEDRIELSRDVAFAEDFPVESDQPAYDVGINIRCGFNGRVNLVVLRDFIGQLREMRAGLCLLVFSTSHRPDEKVRDAMNGLADVEDDLPRWDECLRIPQKCRVNISDSFHGAIFSMLAARPVICCRPDYSSWKMQGLQEPGIPADEILPGFVSPADIPHLVERTIRALDDPNTIVADQNRRVESARCLAEKGWEAVWTSVQLVKRRSAATCV
jgi:polysaccharide pyruvyl transferase WcaK-like protein